MNDPRRTLRRFGVLAARLWTRSRRSHEGHNQQSASFTHFPDIRLPPPKPDQGIGRFPGTTGPSTSPVAAAPPPVHRRAQ